MCIRRVELSCAFFPPDRSFWLLYAPEDRVVQAPASNRLITFGISSFPLGKVHLTHLVLSPAGLQQGSSSSWPVLIGQKEVDSLRLGTDQSCRLQEDAERASVHLRLVVDKREVPLHSGLRDWQRATCWVQQDRELFLNSMMLQAAAGEHRGLWRAAGLSAHGGEYSLQGTCLPRTEEFECLFAKKCTGSKITGNGTILDR